MNTIAVILVATFGLVLLAHRVPEIGERIPMVLLSVWAGSATIAALIFSDPRIGPRSRPSSQYDLTGSRLWNYKLRLVSACLLPLIFVPLFEIRHSGFDPALWLMNGILVVSICSTPYFWLLARNIIGAVVLGIISLSLLWHFSAWALFTIIKRMEAAKAISTVDTNSTLHAFLAPEYRFLFYCLCGMALLIYCPLMLWLGYRRFLTDWDAKIGRP